MHLDPRSCAAERTCAPHRGPDQREPGGRFHEAFRNGLRDLGWVEGQTIAIEYRFSEGRFDRLPQLADELVRLAPEVLVAQPTRFEFVINRGTAKMLGLSIAPAVLHRADDVVG